MNLSFTVVGKPEPQGSMRAFIPKGWRRPILTSDNKDLKPYRQAISVMALQAMGFAGAELARRDVPVELKLAFYFAKPKSRKKHAAHTTRPDASKLARAAEDSLTGIVFEDDSQIVNLEVKKRYGTPERTEVTVRTLDVLPSEPDASG